MIAAAPAITTIYANVYEENKVFFAHVTLCQRGKYFPEAICPIPLYLIGQNCVKVTCLTQPLARGTKPPSLT